MHPGAAARRPGTPSVTELVALPQVQALPEVLHPLAQTVERMVEFVDAIATMDAVVVSGGGNLNSRYGWLLYERAAAVRAAEHAGVPVYVTGQSLGPVLNPRTRRFWSVCCALPVR